MARQPPDGPLLLGYNGARDSRIAWGDNRSGSLTAMVLSASDSGDGPNGRTVVTPDGFKLVLYDSDQSMLFDRAKDP